MTAINENDVKNIINSIEDIQKKLNDLNNKIDKIESLLEKVHTSTNNMDHHISFVENIYSVVKSPFYNLLYWYDKNTNLDDLKLLKN